MAVTPDSPVGSAPHLEPVSTSHQLMLRHTAVRLLTVLGAALTLPEVEHELAAEYANLARTARIKDFLLIFAERGVRERHRAVGRSA
ncbi:MAG: DUF3562 domain-containing protein [Candidatus Dormibacteraeota bacterium]|nr:DUF3562 domain-containing protein [Candidatus Dormibacteraeota bacterium]